MLTHVALDRKTEHFVNAGSIYDTNMLILHLHLLPSNDDTLHMHMF